MPEIRIPATSANLGPGFDCLGIAWNLYDTFTVEKSEQMVFENVEERFCNDDNLFLKAFRRAGGRNLKVRFDCGIPVSRGLGSSAAMIAGGILAAKVLGVSELSPMQEFELACEMEGHPDNAAPCLFGGLTACLKKEDGSFLYRSLPLSEKPFFTVLIPDVETSTEMARSILPSTYSKEDAAGAISHGILMVEALKNGDLDLMKEAARDRIHEPYRSTLIPHFKEAKHICTQQKSVFLISGSGSTCLCISEKPLSREAAAEIRKLPESWKIIEVKPANGCEVKESESWKPII